jgi:hypothetical protein
MGIMAKKEWELALGERKIETGEHDEVLSQAVTDSRIKRLKMAEELSEAEHEAKMAKFKKEVEQASGGSNTAPKKDSDNPFKFGVTGEVNLGKIDLDEERKRASEELKILKKEQDEQLRTLGSINDELRERIHAKEMEALTYKFESQMNTLMKMIDDKSSRGDFTKQLEAAKETAALLGYQPNNGGGGGRDIALELKLKEIEHNNLMQLRQFEEEAKDREIQRRIDLQKLEDDREFRKAEAERQAKRDEMFASFPEILGRGIARGLAERSTEQSPNPTGASLNRQPQPGIVAPIGEEGEANCGNCGTVMWVGKKSTQAVCAKCGTRYPIQRVEPETATEEGKTEIPEEDE